MNCGMKSKPIMNGNIVLSNQDLDEIYEELNEIDEKINLLY